MSTFPFELAAKLADPGGAGRQLILRLKSSMHLVLNDPAAESCLINSFSLGFHTRLLN